VELSARASVVHETVDGERDKEVDQKCINGLVRGPHSQQQCTGLLQFTLRSRSTDKRCYAVNIQFKRRVCLGLRDNLIAIRHTARTFTLSFRQPSIFTHSSSSGRIHVLHRGLKKHLTPCLEFRIPRISIKGLPNLLILLVSKRPSLCITTVRPREQCCKREETKACQHILTPLKDEYTFTVYAFCLHPCAVTV
jgi:hypothetical protein